LEKSAYRASASASFLPRLLAEKADACSLIVSYQPPTKFSSSSFTGTLSSSTFLAICRQHGRRAIGDLLTRRDEIFVVAHALRLLQMPLPDRQAHYEEGKRDAIVEREGRSGARQEQTRGC
jgi:hypothetical protein